MTGSTAVRNSCVVFLHKYIIEQYVRNGGSNGAISVAVGIKERELAYGRELFLPSKLRALLVDSRGSSCMPAAE